MSLICGAAATDLISLGEPERFRSLTIACKPFNSSNTRRPWGASTRMHSRVSRVTQVRCIKAGFTLVGVPLSPLAEDEGVLSPSFEEAFQGTWREVRSMSRMIYGCLRMRHSPGSHRRRTCIAYCRPKKRLLPLCVSATPCIIDRACASCDDTAVTSRLRSS